MAFKDNFSAQAAEYAKFRPRYPESLFKHLAGLCARRECAWDCATGNGQCAVPLAHYFESVIATDASEKQLANAEPNRRVVYRVASAEESGLTADSVDLITVAQALHWFRIARFWQEAKRVLRSGGLITVWCYAFIEITPEIDAVANRYYSEVVGSYWDFERKLVEDGYRSVSFPFVELHSPSFAIEVSWSLSQLVGYLESWSATQKFIAQNGRNPVDVIAAELKTAWGDPDVTRPAKWPLQIRVGRNMPGNS